MNRRNCLEIVAALFVGCACGGEVLYNGIVLPDKWPPTIDPKNEAPLRIPYLEKANIPAAIPIDVGRQLFVDDFLVESTSGVTRSCISCSASATGISISHSKRLRPPSRLGPLIVR